MFRPPLVLSMLATTSCDCTTSGSLGCEYGSILGKDIQIARILKYSKGKRGNDQWINIPFMDVYIKVIIRYLCQVRLWYRENNNFEPHVINYIRIYGLAVDHLEKASL